MKVEIYPLDRVELDGKSVSAFEIGAEKLVELLTQKNTGVVRNAEHWATIGFGVTGYYER
ncbi:MAG: hypothetical protein E7260_09060 [Lachnospiraceae bacterium]|nr:hypothetical protein [Lachnospiraceae bacterium]